MSKCRKCGKNNKDRMNKKTAREIDDFLSELQPDDAGNENIGRYVIYYEGFTTECWEDAKSSGKSIYDLEKEIVSQWKKETKTDPLEYNWKHGGEFFEDDVFFAIFPRKVKM